MRKALLSIGLVAASASYVGLQNHVFDRLVPGQEGTVLPAVAEESVAPGLLLQTTAPAPADILLMPSAPIDGATTATTEVAATEAIPAPSVPDEPIAKSMEGLGIIVADSFPTAPEVPTSPALPSTSEVPPLPRSRPAAADAALQSAQSVALAAPAGAYRDGTYKGTSENAYYGQVQVQITVSGNQISRVDVLDFPDHRRTSRNINARALPILESEVIEAQDAHIDGVSGATLTSEAYVRSLAKAVKAARGNNA